MADAGDDAATPERRASRIGPDPVVVLYLVVLVVVAVQLLTGREPAQVLSGAVPYIAAALVYLAVRWWRGRGPRATSLISGVAVGGCVLALWLLTAFVVALPAGVDDPSGFYRVKVQVTSPIGDHNTAAGLLLVAVVAAAVRVSDDRRWWYGLALCGAGLVATLSRGAALVLLVVVLVAWLWVGDRRAAGRVFAIALASLVAIVALAAGLGAAPPDAGRQATPEAQGPLGASLIGRADLILRGGEVFADEPLLGVGLRGFEDRAGDLPPPNHHAHNVLTHAAAEGGVGLLLVAALLPLVLAVRWGRAAAGPVRDLVLLGGAGLVLHAQHDIMGGLLGYEVVLALLLAAIHRRRIEDPA